MIGERKSTDSPIPDAIRVGVFPDWTQIEYLYIRLTTSSVVRFQSAHPKILSMPVFQKLLGILSAIAVQSFYSRGWVSHYDDLISYVD